MERSNIRTGGGDARDRPPRSDAQARSRGRRATGSKPKLGWSRRRERDRGPRSGGRLTMARSAHRGLVRRRHLRRPRVQLDARRAVRTRPGLTWRRSSAASATDATAGTRANGRRLPVRFLRAPRRLWRRRARRVTRSRRESLAALRRWPAAPQIETDVVAQTGRSLAANAAATESRASRMGAGDTSEGGNRRPQGTGAGQSSAHHHRRPDFPVTANAELAFTAIIDNPDGDSVLGVIEGTDFGFLMNRPGPSTSSLRHGPQSWPLWTGSTRSRRHGATHWTQHQAAARHGPDRH